MTAVLVVDDDTQLLRALRIHLSARGYEVHTAVTGKGAVRAAEEHEIDVVVLDLGLPDLDGTEVITALRASTTVPIIVLSARADSGDKVRALDRGADDYVTKPFGVDELMARLRAAVRRAATVPENGPIDAGELTIDLAAKLVRRSGEEVHLTPTEWSLLDLLVRNRGRLVGRKQLLREVWGPVERKETSYLRVYMAQLRRKLERDPAHPEHLITEAGMGYRFRA
ncbi:two-component system KDP operon response regulator KdpE [Pseudonocardia hierapolitana]|uniref:Transcriptional regulatory protein KdpE n=1 Tax=Pseudonocardia hierapolitana TaxID=1128676 RepID=A0A561SX59_9PSEU|nr:response regulator [Pseudonocardia hierapolitana]TWF79446.1 two-component system KDP operon response regulator KdpE [Pseudonocardia hierapolitana]